MEECECHFYPQAKKDNKELANNYRPISLLPLISKEIERCVFNKLFPYIAEHINSLQHGFMNHRSCVTQLLSVLHSIGQNIDKNIQTDVLYLDLAKAFELVDHEALLKKLSSYGVTGPLLNWFNNYLLERHQRVYVELHQGGHQ